VKLINTDGMVLLGPGSEWFWTAISGVTLAITFLAIYRQLAIARSANAFEQLDKITEAWDSERSVRHRVAILESILSGASFEAIPEGAATYLGNFWEHWAGLVRAGHIDARLMHSEWAPAIRYWNVLLAPNKRRSRAETGYRFGEHFDWLAGVMEAMDNKTGRAFAFDEAYVKSTLDRRLGWLRDELRVTHELRAIVIAAPETSAADQPDALRQRPRPADQSVPGSGN
jgi:hypothetical protein